MKTTQTMKRERKESYSVVGKILGILSFVCAFATVAMLMWNLIPKWNVCESNEKTGYMLSMLLVVGYGVVTLVCMILDAVRDEKKKSVWHAFAFFMVICFSANLSALFGEMPAISKGVTAFLKAYGELGIPLMPFVIGGIGASIYGKFLLDK